MRMTYICVNICKKEFKSRSGLSRHKRLFHTENQLGCGICTKTYKSRDALRRHERTVHQAYIRLFKVEEKNKFHPASDQGQLLLESAQSKRKPACLVKLKELATDRQYLSSLMEKYADVSIVPIIVQDKLNTELSRSLNLPTEEEMTTIFQETEQFETNDLNSIYIEKDGDEELDKDYI
ncbi:uncharacterized protein LOC134718417 [Mytilus trossulus]|uniref:uncharacterized protein LOC134718417 n=1 Tax=Mytilus trossulus TaxID=6551 RepID=UPI0030057DFB